MAGCFRRSGQTRKRAGRNIGRPDVMIAAVAIRSGLAVVTGNSAHFDHVRAARHDLLIDHWRLH